MIGTTISHYRILEKLGEGGMGVVYKAQDTTLKRTVALKFLPPEFTRDPEAKERFIQEAQAASALDHPNICTIHEIGETGEGQLFMAMACYEGETLKKKIGRGAMAPDEAVRVAIQVGEGLAKAHSKGIVHRDIKPANIIITNDGVSKILDFGIAKLAGQVRLTKTSSTLGTVAYMSPEQARGGDIDSRTDTWSLGVVLYEMISGRLPFKGEHEQAMMYSILNEEPSPLPFPRSDLTSDIQAVVRRALAKKPEERYQHITEMLADLKSYEKKLDAMRAAEGAHTQAGRLRRLLPYLIAGCVAIIVLAVIGKMYVFTPREKPITSLAVLPFRNLSADPAQEYFSDGMTEAIIKELSQIKALRVISRTSVMRYKNTEKMIPEIAHELGVDAVVEGSVLRADHNVRITAQLIAAHPEKHLWADDFTRTLEDVLLLQSEVAQAIAREIKVAVTPSEQARLARARVVDPEAHEAYLKGKYFLAKTMPADWNKSIQYFQQAIDEDSTYALAYAGMAEAYDNMVIGVLPPREAWPKVKAYTEKALDLDPALAEGILLIADVKFGYDWDVKGAEEYYRRALELDPNLALAHYWYGFYLTSQRRFSEGIAEMKQGLRLDPLSTSATSSIAFGYEMAGDYDSALVYLKRVAEIDSTDAWLHSRRTSVYLRQGKYTEAINEAKKGVSLGILPCLGDLAMAYALAGQTNRARETLVELQEKIGTSYYPPTWMAAIYCALGEREKALEYLEKGYQERDISLIMPALFPPWCDFVKSDPRYQNLMKKLGLEE